MLPKGLNLLNPCPKMRENFMSNEHVVERVKQTIDSLPGVGVNNNFRADDYIRSNGLDLFLSRRN